MNMNIYTNDTNESIDDISSSTINNLLTLPEIDNKMMNIYQRQIKS